MYTTLPKFFDVGVFAEATHNIDLFSSNIYLTHVLSSALEHYRQLEKEYEEAVTQEDSLLIEKKEVELKICEGNFAMASAMFDMWDKDYS
jgi:hypothetical protein